MASGNGSQQAAVWALGSASAGVVRMNSPGGLALATGPRGGPHQDGLEWLLGRYVRESKWAGG
jgi:hypothetical protein